MIVKKKAAPICEHADFMSKCPLWDYIGRNISARTFWIVVLIFVGIMGGLLGYITYGQQQYQRDHAILHKEINNELKHMNLDFLERLQRMSEDISIIKTKIENGD